jgi:hypothetical protein
VRKGEKNEREATDRYTVNNRETNSGVGRSLEDFNH